MVVSVMDWNELTEKYRALQVENDLLKVNTLVLVNKVSLVNQWKEKLNEFLTVNEQIEI